MNSGPEIQITDLPSAIHGGNGHLQIEAAASSKIIPISEIERKTILNTITQLNGDKLLAARLLGIGKTTLYRKLKEYDGNA
jgi:two-component system response regulator HydG